MSKIKNSKLCFFCNTKTPSGVICEKCEKELVEYVLESEGDN